MTPADIAALITAAAALLAAIAQWHKLFGPRRNGGRAVLRYMEDRLAAAEAALEACLEGRLEPRLEGGLRHSLEGNLERTPPPKPHRTRPSRWEFGA